MANVTPKIKDSYCECHLQLVLIVNGKASCAVSKTVPKVVSLEEVLELRQKRNAMKVSNH